MGAVLSPFTGGGTVAIDTVRVANASSATCAASATWAIVLQDDGVTPFEIDIAASVGDRVEIGIAGMRTGSDLIDIAVVVGTTQVRYMSTGDAAPASDGLTAWYGSGGGPFYLFNVPIPFTVTSGDLDGAHVRFCLVSKGNGTSVIESSASDQFIWCAKNYGPA